MNSLRLAILAIFSTLWFANANNAIATTIVGREYTYVFTAGPEQSTAYNGSTISIQDLNIVSWNVFGDPNGGLKTGDGSFVSSNGVSFYDPNTWAGSFTISGASAPGTFGVSTFFGTLSYSGTNTNSGGFTPGSLNSTFTGGTGTDPGGTWRPVSAPDSGTTFALFAIACGGLGLYCRRARAT
jgi:hypothetical protein